MVDFKALVRDDKRQELASFHSCNLNVVPGGFVYRHARSLQHRGRRASRERFPEAAETVVADFDAIGAIVPLIPWADTLMVTRGILRSVIPPATSKAIVLRASGGPSVLRELSNERLAVDVEDAVRVNAAALAVQVFVGGEHETQSIENLTRLVDRGTRYAAGVHSSTSRVSPGTSILPLRMRLRSCA